MQIAIAHLSDIHFRQNERNNFILNRVDKLARVIRSQTIGVKNVFIVVTGDIAFSGNEIEYSLAQKFFQDLISNVSSDDPKNINFVIIPGNHDCDFSGDQTIRNTLIESIIKNGQMNDTLLNKCLEIQFGFKKFNENIILPNKLNNTSKVFQIRKFNIDDKTIAFYLLNTAWMSKQPERQGQLFFPTDKIDLGNEDGISEDVVITLLHHPYLWFESDNSRKLKDKLENISDIILTGHEHESGSYGKIIRNGEIIEYVEGGILQGDSAEDSQFNIMKIDSDAKQYEISIMKWDQFDQIYKADGEPRISKFHPNKNRPTFSLLLQEDFEKELDDIGIKYSHSAIDTILLDDLYVFPHLRRLEKANSQQLDKSIIRDNIPTFIINSRNILIIGAEKSGKTALSKELFKYTLKNGLLPLLIDGNSIKYCDENHVNSFLKRKVNEIYKKPDYDKYLQMEKVKRVIIIDDFHKMSLNDKGREKLISILNNYFETIVIFGNDQLRFEALLSTSDDSSMINSFVVCELMGFGNAKRSELIKKWHSLGQDKFSIIEEELMKNIIRDERTISNLLGNYIPPYPFFILVLLGINSSSVIQPGLYPGKST